MERTQKLDLILAVLLIFFSVLIYWIIIPDQVNTPLHLPSEFLSPAFAPRVFTIALGLLAFILLLNTISRIRRYSRNGSKPPGNEKVDMESLLKRESLVVAILTICCVFTFSIEYFGMLIPSILLLGGMMAYFGHRNWISITIIMILFPLILYFFFHDLANIILPKGTLFGLEQFL
ncbi:MAG: tripartite tricarboxylate transporter TctB family protein [Candidatus Hodarchaeota archaeon]